MKGMDHMRLRSRDNTKSKFIQMPWRQLICASTLLFGGVQGAIAAPIDPIVQSDLFAKKFVTEEIMEPLFQPMYSGVLRERNIHEAGSTLKDHKIVGRDLVWNVNHYLGDEYFLHGIKMIVPDWIGDSGFPGVPGVPVSLKVGVDTGDGPKQVIVPTNPPMLWVTGIGGTGRLPFDFSAIHRLVLKDSYRLIESLHMTPFLLENPFGPLWPGRPNEGSYEVAFTIDPISVADIRFSDILDSSDGPVFRANQRGEIVQSQGEFVYTQHVLDLFDLTVGDVCHDEGGRTLNYQTVEYTIEYRIPEASPGNAKFKVTKIGQPKSETTCTYEGWLRKGFPRIVHR
jgi:hypothetical protein